MAKNDTAATNAAPPSDDKPKRTRTAKIVTAATLAADTKKRVTAFVVDLGLDNEHVPTIVRGMKALIMALESVDTHANANGEA